MSNDIATIIEKYDHLDKEEILSRRELERDIATIGRALHNNDRIADKQMARNFLLKLLEEIDTTMDDLRTNQQADTATFTHIQKMSDACIAYMKPKGKKG